MSKKQFASRLDSTLLKNLKILAARKEMPINKLLEEAIKEVFKKYGHKIEKS